MWDGFGSVFFVFIQPLILRTVSLEVAKELWRRLRIVVTTVDIGDRQSGQYFVRDIRETAQIDAVHLADRRLGSDAKGADPAVLAELVQILPGVEEVLG